MASAIGLINALLVAAAVGVAGAYLLLLARDLRWLAARVAALEEQLSVSEQPPEVSEQPPERADDATKTVDASINSASDNEAA